MSCGGDRITLAPGDAAEIRGEYVAVPNGRDLIHFTHPSDGSCGTKGGHSDGAIRKIDAAELRKAPERAEALERLALYRARLLRRGTLALLEAGS